MEDEKRQGSRRKTAPWLDAQREAAERRALEQILRAVNPRADTEAAVEGLLGRFERIADVFDAPEELLRGLPEIDARTARLLSAFPDLFRVYVESKQQVRERITDTQIAFHAVQSKFFGRRREILVLLILDSKEYLKFMDVINEGSVRSVPLYMRELLRLCILYDADTVYLAHNHPSGNCTPSAPDIRATREIDEVLSSISVNLADHFIFTDDDYVSMRASGILQKQRHDRMMQKRQLSDA